MCRFSTNLRKFTYLDLVELPPKLLKDTCLGVPFRPLSVPQPTNLLQGTCFKGVHLLPNLLNVLCFF